MGRDSLRSRRNTVMENAILVGTHALDELRELSTSAGARIIDEVIQRRERPDPATFIGKGKVEELRDQGYFSDPIESKC